MANCTLSHHPVIVIIFYRSKRDGEEKWAFDLRPLRVEKKSAQIDARRRYANRFILTNVRPMETNQSGAGTELNIAPEQTPANGKTRRHHNKLRFVRTCADDELLLE